MESNASNRRITLKVDYPEPDLVALTSGEGQIRDVERGYLVVGEDNVVRFVPEFDRKPQEEESNS